MNLNERVLILATSHRDAESTSQVLAAAGISCFKCGSIESLEREIGHGAGAIILAKEVLLSESTHSLARVLDQQPKWSYLPVILLIQAGDIARGNEDTLSLLRPIRNTTFLERPVRVGVLLSVVQAALADRKRQYEVESLLKELEESKKDAINASQAKSDFLANMSHEIRTPLGAILGFSELLMESRISEREKTAYMTTIKRNGQLLSALINDILDLAKVEAGLIGVESIDLSVRELVSEVISALEPRASAKKLPLIVKWGPWIPEGIKTDPVRLKQVLINVIGNAIKFTDKGKIQIELSVDPLSSVLKIAVSDTGLGISESQRKHLFQPFTQADTSITRKFGGTGLGLVLSRKLAQALGGDLVLAKSTVDEGSTFEITVDISAKVDAKKINALPFGTPKMHFDQAMPLSQSRILLVEDSKDNQVLIGRILRLAGAEVEVADDGIEGMEMALNHDYDVVLMDIQMPRLGGHEATSRLRHGGYTRPIVALTAHALMEDRQKCIEAGCNSYLTKPIHREELIDTIATFSSHKH